jgi:hypothetical protein
MEVLITDLKRMAQKFLSDDRLTELEVYQCLSSHNGGNYMANIDIAGLEFNVIISYSNIVNYIEKNYPTRMAKFWGEEYTCIIETDDEGEEIYCIPVDTYFEENSLLIVKDLLTLILK